MRNFDFHRPTQIVFGKNRHKEIGSLIKPFAEKVLLHYGSERIKENGVYETITASLREAGISYVELGGVVPNPRVSLVNDGIAICLKEGVDFILAVGGGSVIDSSKAIALGAANPAIDVWSLFSKGIVVEKALPVACILTIPASGSECSNSCVISNETTKRKLGYSSELNRPFMSIIDPTLFATLPKHQIANGVSDMISHILERYFSNTLDTEYSDALCEATLRTLIEFGAKVYNNPDDYDSWCQVALAGTMAHNNVLGVGREQDWACHAMEHVLSAMYDIAHGAGLAVLTPAWMRYCASYNQKRFLGFAEKVMGVKADTIDETIEAGIVALEDFFQSIALPSKLKEMGIIPNDVSYLAEQVVTNEDGSERTVGRFKRLFAEDVESIYQSVL